MAAPRSLTLRFGLMTALAVTACCSVASAAALGVIETPAYHQTQTGIGLISGWHCSGRKIQVRIDGGPPQTAGSGTSRKDTLSVCGRSDTGYGLLMNFNLLPPGPHRMVAYADGVQFAVLDFSTFRIANPFTSGSPVLFPLANFPRVGMSTVVEWDYELKDFRATAVAAAPPVAGDYYGATTISDCNGLHQVRHATFAVAFAPSMLGVTINYADGETVTFPMGSATLSEDGYVTADLGDWTFRANGTVLTGGIRPPLDYPCFTENQVRAAK